MRRKDKVAIVLAALGVSATAFPTPGLAMVPTRGSFPGDNGRIVATRARHGEFREQIVTLAADGSDPVVVAEFRFGATEPAWSADGSQIVFIKRTGGRPDDDRDIWVMNADGSGRTRVTDSRAAEYTPGWSPDGARIVFERGGDIFTIGVNGSGIDRLTDDPRRYNAFPTWSPDGLRIAYAHGVERSFVSAEIFTMAADGTDKVRVTDNRGTSLEPSYSPDGNRIAFQYLTDDSDIAVIDSDGTDRVVITDTRRSEFSPVWAPDGSTLLVSAGGFPFGLEIYSIAPDGSDVTPITSSDRTWSDWPDWQPIVP